MDVSCQSAGLTELGMCEALCTAVGGFTLMTKVTGRGSSSFVFYENRKIVLPMRQPIIQDIISSLMTIIRWTAYRRNLKLIYLATILLGMVLCELLVIHDPFIFSE
jgi:hypothetical protein